MKSHSARRALWIPFLVAALGTAAYATAQRPLPQGTPTQAQALPTVLSSESQCVNVTGFTNADIATALATATATGGKRCIFFPPGTYALENTNFLNGHSDLDLRGIHGRSIITWGPATPDTCPGSSMFGFGPNPAGSYNIKIADLVFDGRCPNGGLSASAASFGTVDVATPVHDIEVRDSEGKNFSSAFVRVSGPAQRVRITNNYIHDATGHGLLLGGLQQSSVVGNTIENVGSVQSVSMWAIYLQDNVLASDGVLIAGNTIKNCYGGIVVGSGDAIMKNITVRDNTLSSITRSQVIAINHSDGVVVEANHLVLVSGGFNEGIEIGAQTSNYAVRSNRVDGGGSPSSAIYVWASNSYGHITGNTVFNLSLTGGTGIWVSGANHLEIAHNSLSTTWYGINIAPSPPGVSHVDISDNMIESGRYGVYAVGGSDVTVNRNRFPGTRWTTAAAFSELTRLKFSDNVESGVNIMFQYSACVSCVVSGNRTTAAVMWWPVGTGPGGKNISAIDNWPFGAPPAHGAAVTYQIIN